MRTRDVIEAYLGGLEDRVRAGKPIDRLASVASFFVSRVDTEVDKRLDARLANIGGGAMRDRLRALRGAHRDRQCQARVRLFQRALRGASLEGARVERARACNVRCGRAPARRIRRIAT